MRCLECRSGSEGFAVIPGIGETGEIRFYCDPCARSGRVKMRYWDGRDLDIGGHRDSPDLGASFQTLIFSFEDLARMRIQDLAAALEWVEGADLAAALSGASAGCRARVVAAVGKDRIPGADRSREGDPTGIREAQGRIVDVIRRL